PRLSAAPSPRPIPSATFSLGPRLWHQMSRPSAEQAHTHPSSSGPSIWNNASCGGSFSMAAPRHIKRLCRVERSMTARTGPDADGAWTREPTYPKPDISVRATTAYYEAVAPLMLPFLEGRLLNLFRCREGKCYFQRSRAHPPSGRDFEEPVKFEPVAQKN